MGGSYKHKIYIQKIEASFKIVLVTTAMLIVGGAGLILIFDIKATLLKGSRFLTK